MVRNNYDLIPEIRCRDCGWYSLEHEYCMFWRTIHDPDGFCDEGSDKCCMNCDCSLLWGDKHRCMDKNEIVEPTYVCDEWERWMTYE